MSQDVAAYLVPTPTVDSDHPAVIAFAAAHAGAECTPRAQAVALYYAVRDQIRYDPYTVGPDAAAMCASATLAAGRAWCVPKAVLLAAACRAVGIPARLGFADVRNHLSTARMRAVMQTDVFAWHGYASLYMEGRWVKATPAFNIELCDKFGLRPLDFDGRADAIYHAFDREGRRHMEYLRFRGEYADVPVDAILATFAHLYGGGGGAAGAALPGGDASFEADVALEPAVPAEAGATDTAAAEVDHSLIAWMRTLSHDERLATLTSFAATFGGAVDHARFRA